MTDETEVLDRDEQIGEPMPSRPTRRDLVERGLDALDPNKIGNARISTAAGGVAFSDITQVMDFAKLMSVSGKLVPKFLRGNAGGCLGITFQAIEWRMSPFQVANKAYEVNDRVGYESQLIHAVVEARAPLQHRLDCRYDGEGATRTCTVIGMFTNGDVREYTTPPYKDIRVKNSPLWKDDPDQQLFYYASRSWARKWVPDVLMGIYSREELAAQPDIGREGEDTSSPGLHARLIGSPRSEDGHRPGHVERELETVSGGAKETQGEASEQIAVADAQEPNKRTSEAPSGGKKRGRTRKTSKAAAAVEQPDNVVTIPVIPKNAARTYPTTVPEYLQWAERWIAETETVDELEMQWREEMKLRNSLGVTADDRAPLMVLLAKRREELA